MSVLLGVDLLGGLFMSLYSGIKKLLIGRSLPTSAHTEERLTRASGLAVLSSDALSSVAYATEEILGVLILATTSALVWSIPIAIAIIVLLGIVILSYRQTIKAYPKGGGSYIVARQNLGLFPGLIAGASLMIDYILTVTVSISAGTAALTSAFPALHSYTIELCILFIILLTIANLRGIRESGNLFMFPTYTFVVCIFILIAIGFFQRLTGTIPPAYPQAALQESFSIFLVLKAFSAGCTALTGVEAISDGVTAFKPPEWKNARATLIYMGVLLGFMFLGITFLADSFHIVPMQGQTVVSQLGRQILGEGIPYYFLQGATLLILLLAANTSFADFPRLCYFLSKDGFLPRQLALLGDRLVYSNGVLLLSLSSAALVVIFRGETEAIIPLYAVGVFTSFTLSQAGMVRRWFAVKTHGWQAGAAINALGAAVTLIVTIIVTLTKFTHGAWLVVVAIPLVVSLFLAINRHYRYVAKRLSIDTLAPRSYLPMPKVSVVTHPAVVLVGYIHRGTIEALDYARLIADEIVAVHVDIGFTDREVLLRRWNELEPGIELVILDSPYRSLVNPLVDFIGDFEAKNQGIFSTIILPAFVTKTWWEALLHNQTTLFLRVGLRTKRSRVITTVRYYL
jgi:amino acid transporter